MANSEPKEAKEFKGRRRRSHLASLDGHAGHGRVHAAGLEAHRRIVAGEWLTRVLKQLDQPDARSCRAVWPVTTITLVDRQVAHTKIGYNITPHALS
jgi:hypothetical protein